MDDGDLRRRQALFELVFLVVVEQKAHRAAVHAVDRDAAVKMVVHGLEHQTIASERDDRVRLFGRDVAIALHERGERSLASRVSLANEGDLFEICHEQICCASIASLREGHTKAVVLKSCKCLYKYLDKSCPDSD